MKRIGTLSAALGAAILLAGQARADFSYVTTITPPTSSFTDGLGTTVVNFGSATGTAPGSSSQSIALITATGDARTGTVTISDDIKITDASGMTDLVIAGTLHFDGGNPSFFTVDSANSTFSGSTPGATYSINAADVTYSYVSINGTPGSLGAFITVSVPEPASVAMLGVGGLLFVAPRLRRITRARA